VDVQLSLGYADEGLHVPIAIRHDHPGLGVLVLPEYVGWRACSVLAERPLVVRCGPAQPLLRS
jgi:hypothetical protein